MKTRIKQMSCLVLILSAAVLIASEAQASKSSQDFIQNATIGNQFEISSSRLALQNSQDGSVKQFAQQMVDDHTRVGNQLKSVIASSSSELKEPDVSLDQKHQKMLDKLNKLSGKDFDKEYVKDQVSAHDDAVLLFKKYAKSGDDANLKTFAGETLPTLKEHQQYINKINASM
jgi:putative membrane protein